MLDKKIEKNNSVTFLCYCYQIDVFILYNAFLEFSRISSLEMVDTTSPKKILGLSVSKAFMCSMFLDDEQPETVNANRIGKKTLTFMLVTSL